MKAPDTVTFTFNPYTCEDITVFKNRTGFILWACIKSGHLTDQYFNGNIQKVVNQIEAQKPHHYLQFKQIIRDSDLSVFGRKTTKQTCWVNESGLDDEFWKDIWSYIIKEKKLNVIIKERI